MLNSFSELFYYTMYLSSLFIYLVSKLFAGNQLNF